MRQFGFNRTAGVVGLAVATVALIAIIIGQSSLSNSGYQGGEPVSHDGQSQPDRAERQTTFSPRRTDGANATTPPTQQPGPASSPNATAQRTRSVSAVSEDISTLWRRDDSASARELGDIAKADPDKNLQLKAVVALGQMDQKESIVQLVETLTAGDNWQVQVRARKILLRRLGLRFGNPPSPADLQAWAKMVNTIRALPGVKAAYAARENHEGQP